MIPNISNFMPHAGLHWVNMVRDETRLEKWLYAWSSAGGLILLHGPPALRHQIARNAHARSEKGQ